VQVEEDAVDELQECLDHRFEFVWTRQTLEHISLGLQMFNLCFNYIWRIKFRSWLQPLLHFILFTLFISYPCYTLVYRVK
jgi:hypothetical protein